MTGCPEGGSRTTYRIYLYDNTTGSTGEVATDSGSGSSVTLISGHTYICNIHIGPSQTVSDLTFHPMLRLASIQDDTYVPYAMTNQELTTLNQLQTGTITNLKTGTFSMADGDKIFKRNGICEIEFDFIPSEDIPAFTPVFTIPSDFVPLHSFVFLSGQSEDATPNNQDLLSFVSFEGNVYLSKAIANGTKFRIGGTYLAKT